MTIERDEETGVVYLTGDNGLRAMCSGDFFDTIVTGAGRAEVYGPPLHADHVALAVAGAIGMSYETMSADYAAMMRAAAFSPPCAAYFIADAMNADIVAMKRAFRTGLTHFTDTVLDALKDAGIVVEDLPGGGCVLHLPSGGGSVSGRGLEQMLSKPLSIEDFDITDMKTRGGRAPADYLRHDPTKNHSRRKRR